MWFIPALSGLKCMCVCIAAWGWCQHCSIIKAWIQFWHGGKTGSNRRVCLEWFKHRWWRVYCAPTSATQLAAGLLRYVRLIYNTWKVRRCLAHQNSRTKAVKSAKPAHSRKKGDWTELNGFQLRWGLAIEKYNTKRKRWEIINSSNIINPCWPLTKSLFLMAIIQS